MALFNFKQSPVLRGVGNWLNNHGFATPQVIEKTIIQEEEVMEARHVGMSTGFSSVRHDLTPQKAFKVQQLAEKCYLSHPLAKKAITLRKNFVCGEGFKLESASGNEHVQAWLDEHWAINWENRVEKRCESLSVYGELAYWQAPPNTVTGQFEIGAIDRTLIQEVLPHPLNCERPAILKLQSPLTLHIDDERITKGEFDIYNYSWLRKQWQGEVWYLGVNTLDSMHRGMSDLLPVLDWLEVFDQLVYTEAERVKMLRSLLFHMTIEGATPEAVRKKQRDMAARTPPPGSYYVSNEKERIELLEANSSTQPVLAFIEYIFGLCAGHLDMPQHYFYTSSEINRANGDNMKAPIFAGARSRKATYSNLMLSIAQHGIDQAAQYDANLRKLTAEEREVKISSRDPERDSFDAIGAGLKTLGESLMIAQVQEWMSPQQCGEKFRDAAGALGLGEIEDPDSLEDAMSKVDQALEIQRPQLEKQFPLSPNGKRNWSTNGRASVPA